MKVVILAGGFGSRIGEETDIRPKPMIEIGEKPIIWHIMKHYSSFGFNEFIILLGYKGYVIKEFFSNYFLHQNDITIDIQNNEMEVHHNHIEPWRITLLETGLNTMTGGRIKQVEPYIEANEFLLTYGDGVSDVNINDSIDFHRKQNKHITMTAVMPAGRYGAIDISNNNMIKAFKEKPKGDGSWINGGFFVCSSKVFGYIKDNNTIFEEEPLINLANDGQMMAFKHSGFWGSMDTQRDKKYLCELWDSGKAPWKTW